MHVCTKINRISLFSYTHAQRTSDLDDDGCSGDTIEQIDVCAVAVKQSCYFGCKLHNLTVNSGAYAGSSCDKKHALESTI